MEKNTFLLFLLICLLGETSRRALPTQASENDSEMKSAREAPEQVVDEMQKEIQKTVAAATDAVDVARKEEDEKSGSETTQKRDDEKEQKRNAFPVGHRIEVQVHHGVYVVERAPTSPEVLTISLQLPDGTMQQFGFVPMHEVTTMLEEAESLGSGLPEALLDAKFLSYAFDQEETAVEVTKPDIVTTTKLAQQFIEAEAQAEEQGRIHGKAQNEDDDEEVEEDDDEEGDEEDGEEEDDEDDKDAVSKEGSLRGSNN